VTRKDERLLIGVNRKRSADGQNGALTQCMVRPCVARRFWRAGGRRSCINVSGLELEVMLRATMDISAPVTSLADRP
jgi:hypothetical protein